MTKTEVYKSKNSQRRLNQLLRLYERNYQRIIKFFPIQDEKNNINYLIPEGEFNSEINLSCKKLSSHTSVIEIKKNKSVSLLPDTEIQIYIYHDAKMAEVRKFNGKKQFWLRNKYPNKNMLSKDEKFQWNYFLEEFLIHTKNCGLSVLKIAL
tara:strand:- start:6964 stop:7419 length:456 start_codon:yes stop_codon:yes gene_type:complete